VVAVSPKKGVQQHARAVGDSLLAALRPLADHPLVGDVRGSGLFIGVELVKERETLEPATQQASEIVNRMRDEGILFGTDGPYANVLKIRPPMPFTKDDASALAATLGRVLRDIRW
jgi:4-aminobutyrate aminotransferase-like enzyme